MYIEKHIKCNNLKCTTFSILSKSGDQQLPRIPGEDGGEESKVQVALLYINLICKILSL